MSVGRSFAKQLCASAVVVLVCGSTQSLAQNGEYYLVGQGSGTISVIQGGAVNRSWSTVNGTNESPIAVSDRVYTTGFSGPGSTGGIYELDGTDTGGRPEHPAGIPGSFFDAASNGTNNFVVDFGTGDVYSTDLDYANPVRLFTVSGNQLGITWDNSNNSLWISQWGGTQIANYDMDGTLLSTFVSETDLNIALAMDYSDGTLWGGDRNTGDGTFYQWNRAGTLLNTIVVSGVAGNNNLGGEFAVIPAPGTLALAGLGLAFAGKRRR